MNPEGKANVNVLDPEMALFGVKLKVWLLVTEGRLSERISERWLTSRLSGALLNVAIIMIQLLALPPVSVALYDPAEVTYLSSVKNAAVPPLNCVRGANPPPAMSGLGSLMSP